MSVCVLLIIKEEPLILFLLGHMILQTNLSVSSYTRKLLLSSGSVLISFIWCFIKEKRY